MRRARPADADHEPSRSARNRWIRNERGTGRSTPVTALPDRTPEEQAEYLALFRADPMIADAELIRREMTSPPWAVLGQSFGGFCAVTCLSRAPEALSAVYITGELAPIGRRSTTSTGPRTP
jgi:pimeloyl-ACP methyl ester carboxylesterase